MASYTMQLKTYIERWSQDEDFLPSRERIERGQKKLFDFEYPIFDEDYRNVFETHFIRNFYMREIGFETEGLFKFQLESWLMINMPYFNKLYESELIKFDPLMNSKMEKLHQKDNEVNQNIVGNVKKSSETDSNNESINDQTQNTKVESVNDNFQRDLVSTNPDSRVAISTQDGKGVIEYASQIDESKFNDKKTIDNDLSSNSKQNDKASSNVNTKQDDTKETNSNEVEFYLEKKIGKVGSQTYSKMLQEYRQSFLRIENQIFQEMQKLFMLVY